MPQGLSTLVMATEELENLTAVSVIKLSPRLHRVTFPCSAGPLCSACLHSQHFSQSLEILGRLNPVTATGGFCWETGSLYVEVWLLLSALSCMFSFVGWMEGITPKFLSRSLSQMLPGTPHWDLSSNRYEYPVRDKSLATQLHG